MVSTAFAEENAMLLPEKKGETITPQGFYSTHQWSSLRLNRSMRAVSSDASGTLLGMDRMGRVFVLETVGWRQVLGIVLDETKNEEDILLEVTSSLEDLALEEEEEVLEFEADEMDGSLDTQEDATSQTLMSADLQQGIFDPLLDSSQDGGEGAEHLLWYDATEAVHYACRATGCLVSTDRGQRWKPALDIEQATHFFRKDKKIWLATSNGILLKKNAYTTWQQVSAPIPVYRFIGDQYAGTAKGLLRQSPSGYWEQMLPARYADLIVVDGIEGENGALWLLTSAGLLQRSRDTDVWVMRNIDVDLRRLLPLAEAGHWLAYGGQKILETLDYGKSWQPLQQGLPSSEIVEAILWKGSVVLATTEGAYHLVLKTHQQNFQVVDGPMDINRLLKLALMEIDLQSDLSRMRRSSLIRYATPIVAVYGEYNTPRSISADYGSIASKATTRNDWKFGFNLCFGLCGTAIYDTEFSADEQVSVIDGQVFSEEDTLPAANSVSSALSRYQYDLADYVVQLYMTWLRLEAQKPALEKMSLQQQVSYLLEVEEVISRLDAVTDGRFGSSRMEQ